MDEIVVIDDASTDATAVEAAEAGARVVAESSILPAAGPGSGKGNALWKSLHACDGDLICWLDADVRDFRSHFVSSLVAPLLFHRGLVLTKGYYQRPLRGEHGGGGRVTELVARPLLSHLFPTLAEVVQPLSGEYAVRRSAVETLPFVMGWGVEIGLLIDVCERFGFDAIAQVDLGVREHRNRPLADLGPQALAVLVTALRRAGLGPVEQEPAELVRFDPSYSPERVAVEVRERPPIATIAEYRARSGSGRRGGPGDLDAGLLDEE
ncbi:MAG: glucosyl-3-phosphoglycerate synthase [Acidimicrobiia bacterium]|nr:glucosyl-3-phosphoglycerate synthase [Acidimicrobiia bacterium]